LKFGSLEHYGASPWRLACVGVAAASAAWLAASSVLGDVLGQAKPGVLLLVAALTFYMVARVPGRLMAGQRVAEAREAVPLSAFARACLSVTGSRAKTLMLLRPRDSVLARPLRGAARMVLLGTGVEDALEEASRGLASSTAAAALAGLATLRPEGLDSDDEEARGLAASMDLSAETRLPMFMTVCFFAPIMTLLYAVFSHAFDPASLAELTTLEFIVVDIAFHFAAAEKGGR
jgi:hypothetical protein